MPSQARIRDLDIEFYQRRVGRDPRSARDYAQLAGLYLQRARETADNGDLVRAEQNARRSLRSAPAGTPTPSECWPRASWLSIDSMRPATLLAIGCGGLGLGRGPGAARRNPVELGDYQERRLMGLAQYLSE